MWPRRGGYHIFRSLHGVGIADITDADIHSHYLTTIAREHSAQAAAPTL